MSLGKYISLGKHATLLEQNIAELKKYEKILYDEVSQHHLKPLLWFRATSYWKAFLLGALVIAISTTISLRLRDYLTEKNTNETVKDALTGLVTAVAAFITYAILHVVCGFGGGMLADPIPHREKSLLSLLL